VAEAPEATMLATSTPNVAPDEPARAAGPEAPTGTRIADRDAPLHDPNAATRTRVETVALNGSRTRRMLPWLIAATVVAIAIATAIAIR
jgi:hypothetical protein